MQQRLHLKLSPNPRATLPMLPKVDYTGCRREVPSGAGLGHDLAVVHKARMHIPFLVGLRPVATKPGSSRVAFRRAHPLTCVSKGGQQGPSEEGLEDHQGAPRSFQNPHHPPVSCVFSRVGSTEPDRRPGCTTWQGGVL